MPDSRNVYQGFSLLTANREVFADPALRAIASKHGMGLAQVVFRFARYVGMLPLAGKTNVEDMKEDLQSEQLTLSTEDIQRIKTTDFRNRELQAGQSTDWPLTCHLRLQLARIDGLPGHLPFDARHIGQSHDVGRETDCWIHSSRN